MKLYYEIFAKGIVANLLDRLPHQFQDIETDCFWLHLQKAYYYKFSFLEEQFPLIPSCRDWLHSTGEVKVTENGVQVSSKEDAINASLVHISPGEWRGVELLSPPIVYRDKCHSCSAGTYRLVKDTDITIKLPNHDTRPTIFWCREANMIIMSTNVVKEFQAAKLDCSLKTFPVEIWGEDSSDYVAVSADVDLGWPAAPFGSAPDICKTCGATYPRYNFYAVYNHPVQEAQWMWSRQLGPASLYITNDVVRFMFTKGELFISDVVNEPNFYVHGWYPDEQEQAFLPQQYHA